MKLVTLVPNRLAVSPGSPSASQGYVVSKNPRYVYTSISCSPNDNPQNPDINIAIVEDISFLNR